MNVLEEANLVIDEKTLATMKHAKDWSTMESLDKPGVVAGDDDCDCDCKDCD